MNLLIDGSSLLFRSYFRNKARNQQSVKDDIYIFLNSLKSYVKMFEPDEIYIAWDKRLDYPCTNFREEATKGEYKSHRDKEAAKDVFECEEKLKEVTESLGCKNIYPKTLEADDVISWLSTILSGQNIIVTTDSDMLQLINERTSVYRPRKKKLIDTSNFEDEAGVQLKYFVIYKAILGDKSDNIPGVNGYGKVGARKLAKTFYSVPETIDKNIVSIINNNIHLIDLQRGYLITGENNCYQEQLNTLNNIEPDINKFKNYCKEYNYGSFLKKFGEWENLFKGSRLMSILNNLSFD